MTRWRKNVCPHSADRQGLKSRPMVCDNRVMDFTPGPHFFPFQSKNDRDHVGGHHEGQLTSVGDALGAAPGRNSRCHRSHPSPGPAAPSRMPALGPLTKGRCEYPGPCL